MTSKKKNGAYAALSDNVELMNDFSKLNYKTEYEERGTRKIVFFKERAERGDSNEIYCDTMIKSMVKDFEGLEKNIQLYEKLTSQKKKNKWMEPDFQNQLWDMQKLPG